MKIAFYSTNSDNFDGSLVHYFNFPSNTSALEELCLKNPQNQYFVICQKPGLFLLELENNELKRTCKNLTCKILNTDCTPEMAAEEIAFFKPDLALAVTFWVTPYDWLPVKDALTAELLNQKGIKTLCHSSLCASTCFNKYETKLFLQQNRINHAKSILVHHELYWTERGHSEIAENVYKNYVHREISKLTLPLVIKDTSGLSSYGMEVVTTYKQAIGYLNSKKNNADKLVEEYIDGLQFGTEIYGKNGKYEVLNPFLFSTNQYGITSPKQSVKLGPVNDRSFGIKRLKKMLVKMAKALNLQGIAQVDLVWSNKKWYVIEINPRLSGLTRSACVSLGTNIPELLQNIWTEKKIIKGHTKVILDIKYPILEETKLKKLAGLSYVKYIGQTVNDAAKQRRECGYCEVIIQAENYEKLLENLMDIKKQLPEKMEAVFFESAVKMINKLKA